MKQIELLSLTLNFTPSHFYVVLRKAYVVMTNDCSQGRSCLYANTQLRTFGKSNKNKNTHFKDEIKFYAMTNPF